MMAILKKFFREINAPAREQWIEQQLSALPSGSKILDAGCGTQPYRKYANHLQYTSQDFGEYDGTGDGLGMQTAEFRYGAIDIKSDIWNIPRENNSFDAILCSEVLEHIPFPNETIKEFGRLLVPGGMLILTAPFASIPHMTPYFFYSGFSPDYYENIFKQSGLATVSIETSGDQFLYVEQELRRFLRSQIGIFQKSIFFLCAAPTILWCRASSIAKSTEEDFSPYLPFGFHVLAKKPVVE